MENPAGSNDEAPEPFIRPLAHIFPSLVRTTLAPAIGRCWGSLTVPTIELVGTWANAVTRPEIQTTGINDSTNGSILDVLRIDTPERDRLRGR
jgi:hypothetical protein